MHFLNIYYSEVLQSSYIVIGVTDNDLIEIKLLDKPNFRSVNRALAINHAMTTLSKLNEREPIGKMNIMGYIKLFIVPKS